MLRFFAAPRRLVFAAVVAASVAAPTAALAQRPDSATAPVSSNYWQKLTLGAATSILLHEGAHIAVAFAVGDGPHFGFDKLRPTVYSGIDSHVEPHKQYLFSVAGLVMQSAIDEAILDIPHRRGGAFERGLLAGGIGTTLFYLTIGRRGSVSDIEYIARMHGMTRAQSTLVFGGIAALHTVRISRDSHYANFFSRPRAGGGLDIGINIGAR